MTLYRYVIFFHKQNIFYCISLSNTVLLGRVYIFLYYKNNIQDRFLWNSDIQNCLKSKVNGQYLLDSLSLLHRTICWHQTKLKNNSYIFFNFTVTFFFIVNQLNNICWYLLGVADGSTSTCWYGCRGRIYYIRLLQTEI